MIWGVVHVVGLTVIVVMLSIQNRSYAFTLNMQRVGDVRCCTPYTGEDRAMCIRLFIITGRYLASKTFYL
jgi:hypothetical protein